MSPILPMCRDHKLRLGIPYYSCTPPTVSDPLTMIEHLVDQVVGIRVFRQVQAVRAQFGKNLGPLCLRTMLHTGLRPTSPTLSFECHLVPSPHFSSLPALKVACSQQCQQAAYRLSPLRHIVICHMYCYTTSVPSLSPQITYLHNSGGSVGERELPKLPLRFGQNRGGQSVGSHQMTA